MAEALNSFCPADLVRINRASKFLARGPWSPEDLRQEAMARAIVGERHCPRDVEPAHFIIGVMRSIISSDAKSAARANRKVLEIANSDFAQEAVDTDGGPEACLFAAQELERIRTSILSLFEDGSTERLLVEGIMEHMEGSELCEIAEINPEELATKRKFIRRRISSAFPNGWNYGR